MKQPKPIPGAPGWTLEKSARGLLIAVKRLKGEVAGSYWGVSVWRMASGDLYISLPCEGDRAMEVVPLAVMRAVGIKP